MAETTLQTTNVLLTVLTVAYVLQLLIFIACAVAAYRAWHRVQAEIADIARRQVTPLAGEVQAVLGEVRHATSRVNAQLERVDRTMETAAWYVNHAGALVRTAMLGRAWPVLAVARGLRAAVNAMRGPSSSVTLRP